MKHAARESVQRSMMFTSFCIRIKRIPKRHYYLFSFNLNLYLLTLALENLYFNTLDREKVQGKSLGCINSRGDTSPAYCTPTLQGATAEARVADPWSSVYHSSSNSYTTEPFHVSSPSF